MDRREVDVSTYIFSASATLVGICLTVIGLIHNHAMPGNIERVPAITDDLLTLDALGFLLACGLSYLAMRSKKIRWYNVWERTADAIFIMALMLMTVVCGVMTYEIF